MRRQDVPVTEFAGSGLAEQSASVNRAIHSGHDAVFTRTTLRTVRRRVASHSLHQKPCPTGEGKADRRLASGDVRGARAETVFVHTHRSPKKPRAGTFARFVTTTTRAAEGVG
jgi:hypothetical protein